MELIRDLCVEYNVLAITRIYEHISTTAPGTSRLPRSTDARSDHHINGCPRAMRLPDGAWAGGAPPDHHAIRKVHDFFDCGRAAPCRKRVRPL